MSKYRNGHDIEKKELNDLENGLRSQKIEDLGPSEAELELERLRVSVYTTEHRHVSLSFSHYLYQDNKRFPTVAITF